MTTESSGPPGSRPESPSRPAGDVTPGGLLNETETDPDADAQLDAILSHVSEAVPAGELPIDEEIVKANLETIVMLLIDLRGGSHGKQVIADITDLFGVQLSPGTLYPVLHELEDDGLLTMHEKAKTKEYHLADDEAATQETTERILSHTSFGYLLYCFQQARIDADQSQ